MENRNPALDFKKTNILHVIGNLADRQKVEVYAVGGYVRDVLLNRPCTDIDFVVVGDALAFAKAVAKEFRSQRLTTYAKFGTALVVVQDHNLEFVTARKESYRSDSRKPDVVPADLKTDLARRDFTINTLAVALNKSHFGEIVDLFDGREDLENGIIRTPLDPVVTFNDDPLRIMRAIRFATQLNLNLESETLTAIKREAPRLQIISQERITDELMKILRAAKPSVGFRLMEEGGVLAVVFPEMLLLKGVEEREGFHHKDVFYHTLQVVDNVAAVSDNLFLRYAALVHDIAKPKTKQFVKGKGWTFHNHEELGARMLYPIGKRLRLPNDMTKYAQKLTRLHLRPISLTEEDVTDSAYRRLLVQAGDVLEDLLTLCRADITSQNPRRVKRHLANFDFVVKRLNEVEEKDQMRSFQSPVRGDEIMKICALKPGPMVGKLKTAIEEAILDGKIPNEYDAAYQYLLKIKDDLIE